MNNIEYGNSYINFLDNKGIRIGTYDPQVEGSAERVYGSLQDAKQGGHITPGTYLRCVRELSKRGLTPSEDDRLGISGIEMLTKESLAQKRNTKPEIVVKRKAA